jgi:hypothetical protein
MVEMRQHNLYTSGIPSSAKPVCVKNVTVSDRLFPLKSFILYAGVRSTIQENQNVDHSLVSETGKKLQENYFCSFLFWQSNSSRNLSFFLNFKIPL